MVVTVTLTMPAVVAMPIVTPKQALTIAEADALPVDVVPSLDRVEIRREVDGWHIEYGIEGPRVAGEGPQYVIDTATRAIVSMRYYQ